MYNRLSVILAFKNYLVYKSQVKILRKIWRSCKNSPECNECFSKALRNSQLVIGRHFLVRQIRMTYRQTNGKAETNIF